MIPELTPNCSLPEPPRDLEALLRFVQETAPCGHQRAREVASAIRTVGRLLARPLAGIPTDPPGLRRHLATLHPRAGELSKERLTNIRSLLGRAIKMARVAEANRPVAEALTEPWRTVFDHLRDPYLRSSLAPFARFCSANSIEPEAVSDSGAEAYLRFLEQTALVRNPRTTHQTVCRTWNQAQARIPGWPDISLTIPKYTTTYTRPLSDFPPSFQTEVEACLGRLGAAEVEDLLDESAPVRPLRQSSIRTKRYQIRQFASALVISDVPIERIDGLAVLTTRDHFKLGLKFFLNRDRADPDSTRTVGQIAHTIRSIAKYHLRLPEAELAVLNNITSRLNRHVTGMTDKNRERLAQFQDEGVLARFLAQPRIEMDKLLRVGRLTRNDAVRFSGWLALEILIHAPMRVGNLAGLRTDLQVRLPRSGPGETIVLLRRQDVKNSQPLQYVLPPDLTELLRLYITRIKPLLESDPTSFLFPGRPGHCKRADGLSKQITALVRDTMDIRFSPHLIRHLTAKMNVDANPGDYETPRRLLGHTSHETTYKAYQGMETASASKVHDDLIRAKRRHLLPPKFPPPPRRTTTPARDEHRTGRT
jgi:integrase